MLGRSRHRGHAARSRASLPASMILGAALAGAFAPAAHAASVSTAFKLDNFGYRPGDTKVAIVTVNPGSTVQVRSADDDSVVFTVPADGGSITAKGIDTNASGDSVWWIDFSGLNAVGSYHLASATLAAQSYDFDIRGDVYASPMRAALKTFYRQRCNTPKTAALAGVWSDETACHAGDSAVSAAAGQTDYGTRDLRGGWHDAGDYNKYVWAAASTAVMTLLRAYEDNPAVLRDDDTGIPESGNGIPDLLDEVKVELDWFLSMQLPSGAVLSQMHVDGYGADSPPSADANVRYYRNPNLESGAVAAGTFALASRIYGAEGQAVYADTLKSAALAAWSWVQAQGNSEYKAWAAAEVFRMDPTQTAARDYVDGYHASQWSGVFLNVMSYDTQAAITYVATPGATPAVVANMLQDVSDQVDYIFSSDDLYRNGMPGWSYYWGSNAIRAGYGLFLLHAASFGATGSHSAGECADHALDILRFFHGQNTLNMVYLTNMAALGGEHSSFQFYHAWYGDAYNASAATSYVGKPVSTWEPDYPYFKGTDNHGINDNKASLYGPPPGFVPGGPNKDYSGDAVPPKGATAWNRAYRDWADQTVWTARTWEITENSIGSQGPYVALAASFLGASSCNSNGTCEAGENPSNCAADCHAAVLGSGYTSYRIRAPRTDETGAAIAGGNALPAGWAIRLDDADLDASAGDDPANVLVGKVTGLVTPAELDVTATPATPDVHYVRYAVTSALQGTAPAIGGVFAPEVPHTPRNWTVQNTYGTWSLSSSRRSSLLLPSGMILDAAASAPTDATHYLCYSVKASSGPLRTQVLLRDALDDCALNAAGTPSFAGSAAEGRCLVDLSTPVELCNPATKSAVEAPRTTSATITGSTPSSSESLLCFKAKLARKVGSGGAGLLSGLAAGSSLSPAQAKHLPRVTASGSGLSVAPGNLFPAPLWLDTVKPDVACLPAKVLSATLP